MDSDAIVRGACDELVVVYGEAVDGLGVATDKKKDLVIQRVTYFLMKNKIFT